MKRDKTTLKLERQTHIQASSHNATEKHIKGFFLLIWETTSNECVFLSM